ncbi:hypothetical protein MZE76_24315, partial [Escherichia coli]|nr:hypothetical protein [Escherichia coli]MCK2731240.1 hypothetical protein [Escherichia coli]
LILDGYSESSYSATPRFAAARLPWFLVIFIRITEEYLCKRAWRALPSMKASVNRSQLTLPLCKVGVHSAASNDQSRLTSGLIDFFIL